MFLLKLLIFTLTFYELIVDLDATICPKGHQVVLGKAGGSDGCEICPDEYYQPEENDSQHCRACIKCDERMGSVLKEQCTKEKNTKCQCRREFVPLDSSTCKCNKGFELQHGECSECSEGYFSRRINSRCQKWKECKSGVKSLGTKTSDVICNVELNSDITTPTTSNKRVSLITRLTSQRSYEGDKTQRGHPTTTITTTSSRTFTMAAPGHTRDNLQPLHPSDTGTYIGAGMVLLIFGIMGLLVLTVVTCKLHITPQLAVPKNDSLCRSPVEESGDSSQSFLKLNPEEH
ncbi:tumor necrosis factor receptor superfamily member 4 [Cottoperca gobio]|uniref:Tumor necrosis factor receptor superfamily member 4-like n=1 Tax=Cottoperca gobio TaxID=56716 RepID=A0A6J2PPM1_COTGO|nr:tumor necrosis factor receptor superfamily member 4-like [Cottoperca gobio]XP_029288118.1 tumor necrosis factor receptor superfamily member 4-like [Cottoperca gobio]